MKSKFFVLGCLVAGAGFLASCGGDDDKVITSISVAPATIEAMEVGDVFDLTATITPSDAKDAIKWVSGNSQIVSVTPKGTNQVTIKAEKAGGPVEIYATNNAGIVVSNKVLVTVNQPYVEKDYAKMLEDDGPFVGSAVIKFESAEGPMMTVDMGLDFTWVEKNVVTVAGSSTQGSLECKGDQVITIEEDGDNIITFSGDATMPNPTLPGTDLPVTITGTYNTSTQELSMTLRSNLVAWEKDPMYIYIVDAKPGKYALWPCSGTLNAVALGGATQNLSNIGVGVLKKGASTVSISFALSIMGNEVPVSGDLTLSGNNLSGTLDMVVDTSGNTTPLQTTGSLVNETITLNMTGTFYTAPITIMLTNVP